MNARIPPKMTCKQKKAIHDEMVREYQKVAAEERDGMARRIIKTMIFCLNQEFGFGVGRCARAFRAFTEHMDTSKDDEVYWEHIDQVVIDRMKLPFERDYTDRGKVASMKRRRLNDEQLPKNPTNEH